jgi:DegV family protein with EDD domain
MMTVGVVTDSTSDLPAGVAENMGITVVPAQIQFGDKAYRDGVDMRNEEFYHRLRASDILPKTSPASIGTFRETYQRLSARVESIISIHVASNLSATHDVAKMASVDSPCRVVVVDSQTASMACGLLAIVAARAARSGSTLSEVEAVVREAVPRTITLAVFGTLEYLARGGRIGKAQAFLGSALKVHPILSIKAGQVVPIERVRTRPKAVERLCQIVEGFGPSREMAVMWTTDSQAADDLVSRLSSSFPKERMYWASIGPSMGSQVGPDALGVALIAEKPV